MTIAKKQKLFLITKGCDALNVQKSYEDNHPAVYLVPTPIGNIEDMTYRAVKILKEVSVIYAEDTRHSGNLLKHYEIETSMISLHEHNESSRVEQIIQTVESGKSVALISDAGTPLMSDPGETLVQALTEASITVIALPGATAMLPALITSGLSVQPFVFIGFLPPKKAQKKKSLERIQNYPETLVLYEAPHRIQDTLKELYNVMGNRKIALARELTKRYETIYRLALKDYHELPQLKGEIVIIIEGASPVNTISSADIIEHIQLMISDGYKEMDAIKTAAKVRKIPKNDAYMAYQTYKKTQEGKE